MREFYSLGKCTYVLKGVAVFYSVCQTLHDIIMNNYLGRDQPCQYYNKNVMYSILPSLRIAINALQESELWQWSVGETASVVCTEELIVGVSCNQWVKVCLFVNLGFNI